MHVYMSVDVQIRKKLIEKARRKRIDATSLYLLCCDGWAPKVAWTMTWLGRDLDGERCAAKLQVMEGEASRRYIYYPWAILCNPDSRIPESMRDTAANLVAPGYLDRFLHQDESVLATRRPNSSWWGAFVWWIFGYIKIRMFPVEERTWEYIEEEDIYGRYMCFSRVRIQRS